MGDVEFEPLHVELEDEAEGFYVVGGKKKDTPAKKHKQKGGQLFPRKSVEKKDKTMVIDNSTAFATSPIPSKSGFSQHHHQHRTVEGLVGPGDIQFGSSPPNYDEDSMAENSLPQSPVSVSHSKQVAKTMQLPVRPQPPATWTQASQPSPLKQLQRTLSQEKLTLLEQATLVAGPKAKAPVAEGFKTPERLDERRGFQAQSYHPQTTPPRVASPTETIPAMQQTHVSSHSGKKFERSESWGPSSHSEHANWADFSKSFDGALSADEDELEGRRRRASQVSTISEGSEGSTVSEIDDGVWKITEEQRTYYVKQFKKLQPNEKGLIKGPQARDFFMKSNLPVEVLSKIWHLSDMNKDSALDIEEFCVAMHLVVAVKHEVELPAVLPAMLTPKSSTPPFAASFPVAAGGVSAHASTRLNGHPEEERPHSPEQKVLALDDQQWTNFDADGSSDVRDLRTDEQSAQTTKSVLGSDDADHIPQALPPLDTAADIKTMPTSVVDKERFLDEKSAGHLTTESNQSVPRSPNIRDNKQASAEANASTPVSKDPVVKKASIGIARPRGIGPTINLMDAAPGQLLPPPDSRKNRKMAQQAQPELSGHISPPVSPNTRFASDFSSDTKVVPQGVDEKDQSRRKNSGDEVAVKRKDIDSDLKRVDQIAEKFDSVDGFEPPKLVPRSNQKLKEADHGDASRRTEAAGTNETAQTFIRRSSSVRRGERPRSYTADSRSSMESLVDALPRTEAKDLAVPPTPPPRKTKTHKRGSSLDLNKIFGAKAQGCMDEIKEIIGDQGMTKTLDTLPPRIPNVDGKDEQKEKKERGHIPGIARPRPAPKQHRRSVSHDAVTPLAPLAPPPKTGEGMIKDGPPAGHRKKPAPPRPHSTVRSMRSKSLERTVDVAKTEEPFAAEKKPPRRRPLRQKRKKHEIQAEIRLLRENNASISSLNSELHHELREVMDNRTQLERKLSKTKQAFE